jgi:DUF1680 family protein
METNLPWEGSVKLSVKCHNQVEIAIRIPSWAAEGYKSSVQGEVKNGYLYISTGSSEIDLFFPTEPKFAYAHPHTRKDEVAVTRGPLVYCAESPDNDFNLETTYVETNSIKEIRKSDIAGVKAVPILELEARVKSGYDSDNALYCMDKPKWEPGQKRVTLLPFFLRMNRGGNGAMRVWLKTGL